MILFTFCDENNSVTPNTCIPSQITQLMTKRKTKLAKFEYNQSLKVELTNSFEFIVYNCKEHNSKFVE